MSPRMLCTAKPIASSLLGFLSLLLLSFSVSAKDEEQKTQQIYLGFQGLMNEAEVYVLDELGSVNNSIRRVALYHSGDRSYSKISKATIRMVENELLRWLQETNRFTVKECFECRMTKVKMTKDKLSVRQAAESNSDLKRLAGDLNVDAFLVWEIAKISSDYSINMRLVDADSTEIVWVKKYNRKEQKPDKRHGRRYNITISSWSFDADRNATSPGFENESFKDVLGIGFRYRVPNKNNPHINYSIGLERFGNLENKDFFDASGLNLETLVYIHVPAISKNITSNIYFGLGQAFMSENQSITAKAGFEFPLMENLFIGFGLVYIDSSKIEWEKNPDYEKASTFGGAELDLTLGFSF